MSLGALSNDSNIVRISMVFVIDWVKTVFHIFRGNFGLRHNFTLDAYFQILKHPLNRSILHNQIDISYIFQLCFVVEFYVVEIFRISPKMRLCSFRLCAIFLIVPCKSVVILFKTLCIFWQRQIGPAAPRIFNVWPAKF